jgi:hypothetical protein
MDHPKKDTGKNHQAKTPPDPGNSPEASTIVPHVIIHTWKMDHDKTLDQIITKNPPGFLEQKKTEFEKILEATSDRDKLIQLETDWIEGLLSAEGINSTPILNGNLEGNKIISWSYNTTIVNPTIQLAAALNEMQRLKYVNELIVANGPSVLYPGKKIRDLEPDDIKEEVYEFILVGVSLAWYLNYLRKAKTAPDKEEPEEMHPLLDDSWGLNCSFAACYDLGIIDLIENRIPIDKNGRQTNLAYLLGAIMGIKDKPGLGTLRKYITYYKTDNPKSPLSTYAKKKVTAYLAELGLSPQKFIQSETD